MLRRKLKNLVLLVSLVVPLLLGGSSQGRAQNPTPPPPIGNGPPYYHQGRITPADREAAAQRAKAARDAASRAKMPLASMSAPKPGTPDYFGTTPNYANSQLPEVVAGQVVSGTGIRKFVDTLPGLTAAGVNNLGQYIPVAVADTKTYTGSDYYEIGLVQYTEKMHSDLPQTTLRGYVQLETPANVTVSLHITLTYPDHSPILNAVGAQVFGVAKPSYLGPTIVATKDTPTRIKFTNFLPTGAGGDLFIPMDSTAMGAGEGPQGVVTGIQVTNGGSGYTTTVPINVTIAGGGGTGATAVARIFSDTVNGIQLTSGGAGYTSAPTVTLTGGGGISATAVASFADAAGGDYTQNRATLHLHGGNTPWISDGTPHQWTTPAGETTPYPEGVSVYNVPDMPDPGPGSLTFFYTNQQSARLMFYHDHAYGITRLNVYAGEAAGYVLTDSTEQSLIVSGTLPGIGTPLIIQDKTFVPKPEQLVLEDPTWMTTVWGGQGNLWYPHVYMPNQNPWDISGANAMGRWDYGPWFWPPFTGLAHGPVPNPYAALPAEPPYIPGTPNPSLVPEGYMDTPVVNGTAYPVLTVQPQAYRFRILNAANDRFWNLSLYQAASDKPMWNADGTLNDANAGEVPMVPAVLNPAIPFPSDWISATDGTGIRPDILDGRASGVPDPTHLGPSWLQIGTEGGFLPAPVPLDPKPTGYQYNLRNIVVLNVTKHSLYVGPAERADVVVDFSQFAGRTLILYNDAPAPVPAGDPRNDYYTGNLDLTSTGGAPSTLPGYGPNTRTIMQIKVASVAPAGDSLASVTVTNPGANYTAMPDVAIAAPTIPTGTVATATALGSVEHIRVANAGAGYTSVPSVTIAAPASTGGITATATATVRDHVVTAINVVNPGSGYTSAPAVVISGGGATTNATASAALNVTAVTLVYTGTGYTFAPEVSFLGGGGNGAAAHAVLAAGVAYNQAPLDAAFTGPGSVFATSQDPIIVPQVAYNSAYSETIPSDTYVRIQDRSITFTPRGSSATTLTLGLGAKAIQELFETEYGRMDATLGVEIPNTTGVNQTTIPYGYIDPATEIMTDSMTALSPVSGDGTQIWKITHNGVDTHAIHFHLFNVQLINRVGWDGAIRPPEANELGWKETVRMSPLEDAIVALRPVAPKLPFGVPNSIRPMDVTRSLGSTMGFFGQDPNGIPGTVINQLVNFGWEYVWHCHLLGHEENDMMRPMILAMAPYTPTNLVATGLASPLRVSLTWTNNAVNATHFTIQRATDISFTANLTSTPYTSS